MRAVCQEIGADYESLLARVGINGALLNTNDALISYRGCATALEILANETGVGDVGIRQSKFNHPHFPNLGPIVFLARFCNTVREWELLAQEFWAFQANSFHFKVIEEVSPGLSSLRYWLTDGSQPLRQYTQLTLCNILGLVRTITGNPKAGAVLIRLTMPELANCRAMEEFAQCDVIYDAAVNELIFPTELLDYKTQGGLGFSRGILKSYMQHRLERLTHDASSVTTDVGLAIASLLGTGKSDIQSIAELLGVHLKALQRQLAEENTTYSALLEDVREKMAKEMLSHSKVPIANIAALLGYAATPPFTLAFKRWTGLSPFQWRAKHAPTGRSFQRRTAYPVPISPLTRTGS
jgi:AraC-like DNA-binding protein